MQRLYLALPAFIRSVKTDSLKYLLFTKRREKRYIHIFSQIVYLSKRLGEAVYLDRQRHVI